MEKYLIDSAKIAINLFTKTIECDITRKDGTSICFHIDRKWLKIIEESFGPGMFQVLK